MTLQEETLRLGDERERLDERLDELADKIVEADNSAAFQQVGSAVEKQLKGVAHLCEEHGEETTITVRGLGAGPAARVDDRVDDIRAARRGQGNASGSRRNVTAATGLVDAPFLDVDDDASPAERYEAAMDAVASPEMPAPVAHYLAALVQERTQVSAGNVTSLGERLLARASAED